jgi:CheY-like chemotaxis protein
MSKLKRALVVDDSKSARLVLRRMLEKHGLIVDTVESAAKALEFLVSNRPDAIFMDHMMPGMDGFEAVRAIKNNPQTATIPVMMYTSKGGDLYLGQARALGAVGVLPKTVAPAELFESLKRIGLVSERRSSDETGQQNEETASERFDDLHRQQSPDIPVIDAAASMTEPEDENEPVPTQLRRILDQQRVEIRKDLLLGIDTVARQSREKFDRMLDEKIDTLRQQLPPPAHISSVFPTVLLIILLFVSLAWNFSSRDSDTGETRYKTADITTVGQSALAAQQADNKTAADAENRDKTEERLKQAWESVGWALNQDTSYPWDEIALDGARMQTIAQLLDQLAIGGFAGKLVLETHTGEFCLQGDPEKGFELAGEDITLDQCSAIMNPVQATDSPSTHQSLAFANLVASSPWLQDGTIELEIRAVQRSEPLVPYPPRKPEMKAGEWNRIAAANNRVRIQLIPE